MKLPNLKGLGNRQIELITKMAHNHLVISRAHYINDMQHYICIEDAGRNNSYDELTERELHSLINRGILIQFESFRPSIFVDVNVFRLCAHVAIEFRRDWQLVEDDDKLPF